MRAENMITLYCKDFKYQLRKMKHGWGITIQNDPIPVMWSPEFEKSFEHFERRIKQLDEEAIRSIRFDISKDNRIELLPRNHGYEILKIDHGTPSTDHYHHDFWVVFDKWCEIVRDIGAIEYGTNNFAAAMPGFSELQQQRFNEKCGR